MADDLQKRIEREYKHVIDTTRRVGDGNYGDGNGNIPVVHLRQRDEAKMELEKIRGALEMARDELKTRSDDLDRAKAELKEKHDALEALKTALDETDGKSKKGKEECKNKLDEANKALQQALVELKEKQDELDRTKTISDLKVEKLQENITTIQGEAMEAVNKANDDLRKTKDALKKLEKTQREVKIRMDEDMIRLKEANTVREKRDEEVIKDLRKALEQAKEDLMKKHDELVNNLTERSQAAEKNSKEFLKQAREWKEKTKKANADLEESRKTSAAKLQELRDAAEKMTNSQNDAIKRLKEELGKAKEAAEKSQDAVVGELRRQVEVLTGKLVETEARAKKLQEQSDVLKNQNEELLEKFEKVRMDAKAMLEKTKNALMGELDTLNRKHLETVHGMNECETALAKTQELYSGAVEEIQEMKKQEKTIKENHATRVGTLKALLKEEQTKNERITKEKKDESEKLLKTIQSLKNELESEGSKNTRTDSQKDTEITTLKRKVKELTETLENQQKNAKKVADDLKERREEIDTLLEKAEKALKEREATAERASERAVEEKEKLQKKIQDLLEVIRKNDIETGNLKGKIIERDAGIKELETSKKALQNVQRQLAAYEKYTNEKVSEFEETQKRMKDEYEKEKERIKKDVERLETEKEGHDQKTKELSDTLKTESDRFKTETKRLTGEIEKLKKDIQTLNSAKAKSEESHNKDTERAGRVKTLEITRLKKKIEELEQQNTANLTKIQKELTEKAVKKTNELAQAHAAELDRLKAIIARLKCADEEAKRTTERFQETITVKDTVLSERATKIAELEDQIQKRDDVTKHLNRTLEDRDRLISALRHEITNLMSGTHNWNTSVQNEISWRDAEINRLQGELAQLQAQGRAFIEEANQKIHGYEAEINRQRTETDAIKRKNEELCDAAILWQNLVNEKNGKIKDLENKQRKQNNDLLAPIGEVESLREEIRQIKNDKDRLQEIVMQDSEDLKNWNFTIGTWIVNFAKLKGFIVNAGHIMMWLQSNIRTLRESGQVNVNTMQLGMIEAALRLFQDEGSVESLDVPQLIDFTFNQDRAIDRAGAGAGAGAAPGAGRKAGAGSGGMHEKYQKEKETRNILSVASNKWQTANCHGHGLCYAPLVIRYR